MLNYREHIVLGSSGETLRSYPDHIRYSYGSIARMICESDRLTVQEALEQFIPVQRLMQEKKQWPPVKMSDKAFSVGVALSIRQLSLDDPTNFYRFSLAPFARNPFTKQPEFVLVHTYIKKSNSMPKREMDILSRNVKYYLKR